MGTRRRPGEEDQEKKIRRRRPGEESEKKKEMSGSIKKLKFVCASMRLRCAHAYVHASMLPVNVFDEDQRPKIGNKKTNRR